MFVVSWIANWCLADVPKFVFWSLRRQPGTCLLIGLPASKDYLFNISASADILTKTDVLVCGIAQKIHPIPPKLGCDVFLITRTHPIESEKPIYL